ncbi:two-component system, OmpR family, phosphate regulon sensor histidine kinase PhoR [Altererythrobacter xiamenensis]|uniref:histidine kinase n=1 Tax=Altererythrobacter xiamenensis TaxID=1316679 RepID=A0A1Y6FPG5_9SPHN|nr:ATP-binding protein [Altererythrobacter xiamenensis]SMQ74363.1 two-component system, OmpR family, phosphate regulon sensor histidine kinase PhoR [Altererythrobacter xiamenensis]
MTPSNPIPLSGILLALVALVAMFAMGVDPFLAIAVAVVWIGSLFLAVASPPDSPLMAQEQPFTQDNMRDLIEHSSTPLLVTDKDKVALANRAARNLLGSHVVNQDLRVAFRQPKAIKLLLKRKDGATVVKGLVRRRDIWRINRQGIGDGLAVVELINLTAESDISRAHTDFVANASHELRTPLASIIGYVETLRDEGEDLDPKTAAKFHETILKEARRLQSLVSDLMSLSRVEAEKHEEPSEPLDLAPLVERAARDAAGSERADNLRFELEAGHQVRGDAKQLEQLVRNLVDNALKYGASDAPVEVKLVKGAENRMHLIVTDHGEGIAAEHIPHLTRRFYRTDPGRSRASGGTGLGLAIVKHIVERHRGRLDIESEVGKGTSITVRIPLIDEEVEALS